MIRLPSPLTILLLLLLTNVNNGFQTTRVIPMIGPLSRRCCFHPVAITMTHCQDGVINTRRAFISKSHLIAAPIMISCADVRLVYAGNNDTTFETISNIIDPSVNLPKITQRVYLDIQYAASKSKQQPERLVIGLFGEVMPKAVENFQKLCANSQGENEPGQSSSLSYVGTSFYRVIADTTIQGGAIGINSKSGKSGNSAFEGGNPFVPDSYAIRHSKRGLLSMVRNSDGTVDSRFFIQTEDDAGWADERYAAFGIVLEEDNSAGIDLVRRISRVEVRTPQNSPKEPVIIVGCGLL